MKKFNISKKQLFLIIWSLVLTAIFIYYLVSNIQSIISLCDNMSTFKSGAAASNFSESQINEILNTYKTSIVKVIVGFFMTSILYFSSLVLIVQKFRSIIKDRINPPTL